MKERKEKWKTVKNRKKVEFLEGKLEKERKKYESRLECSRKINERKVIKREKEKWRKVK